MMGPPWLILWLATGDETDLDRGIV